MAILGKSLGEGLRGRVLDHRHEHPRDHAIAAWRVKVECACDDGSKAFGQDGPNHCAGAMESRFDDLVTEPEGEPGLRRAHSLDLTQHEHEAIRFGKAVDGLFEHSMELTRVGLVFRAGIAAGQGCQRSG
jgi:hypothetical protein